MVRLDQTAKRQSDRQIEEERAFKGNSGETNRWTSFSSETLNLSLHSLISKAEYKEKGEQERQMKKWKKGKKVKEGGRKRKMLFSSDDVCYQYIYYNQLVNLVNNCKELLLQPAIIYNDTFISVSVQN